MSYNYQSNDYKIGWLFGKLSGFLEEWQTITRCVFEEYINEANNIIDFRTIELNDRLFNEILELYGNVIKCKTYRCVNEYYYCYYKDNKIYFITDEDELSDDENTFTCQRCNNEFDLGSNASVGALIDDTECYCGDCKEYLDLQLSDDELSDDE
jgi:hypothetical protein